MPGTRTLAAVFEDVHLQTIEHFAAAPFEADRWKKGLQGLADIGGGSGAQLLGFSPTSGIGFDWIAGIPQEALDEFEARDGANPKVNPRAVVVNGAPLLQPICDYDLLDERTRSHHPFYQDFLKRVDASFECSGALYRKGDFQAAAIVLRSERTGHTDVEDVRRIASVFPAISTSIRLQLHLENQGVLAAAGALGALTMLAVFCDAWGHIVGMSVPAEQMLHEAKTLRVRAGVLEATDVTANRNLRSALRLANSKNSEEKSRAYDFKVRLAADGTYLRVAPLPRTSNIFGCGASAIVLVQMPKPVGTNYLQSSFSFSPSEADIARLLAEGATLDAIADQRGVTVATVRAQLKSVFSKAGVHRQAELVSIIKKSVLD